MTFPQRTILRKAGDDENRLSSGRINTVYLKKILQNELSRRKEE
jgi:hypothetical protein